MQHLFTLFHVVHSKNYCLHSVGVKYFNNLKPYPYKESSQKNYNVFLKFSRMSVLKKQILSWIQNFTFWPQAEAISSIMAEVEMAKNIYLQMWFLLFDVKNVLPFGHKTADILFFFRNLYMPHCVTITKPWFWEFYVF